MLTWEVLCFKTLSVWDLLKAKLSRLEYFFYKATGVLGECRLERAGGFLIRSLMMARLLFSLDEVVGELSREFSRSICYMITELASINSRRTDLVRVRYSNSYWDIGL